MCVCVRGHTHTHTHTQRERDQERSSDLLELELKAVVSCLTWVLGTELRSLQVVLITEPHL